MTSPQVFVSYSQKSKEHTAELAVEIRGRGLRTWQDVSYIRRGLKFESEIRAGMAASDGCLVHVTEHALRSRWLRRLEIPLAVQLRTTKPYRLIPVFEGFEDFQQAGAATEKAFGVNLAEYSGCLIRADGDLVAASRDTVKSFYPKEGDMDTTRGSLRIGFHTRAYTPGDHDLNLDWTALLDRPVVLEESWRRLWTGLLDINKILRDWSPCRRIILSGVAHLGAAFAFGMAFPVVSRYEIAVQQGPELWERAQAAHHDLLISTDWGNVEGDVVTVEVSAAREIHQDVAGYLTGMKIQPRARLLVRPGDGSPSRTSLSANSAWACAADVAEALNRLRADVRPRRIMIFLAAPMAFAVFLGSQVNAAGASIETYEFEGNGYYRALVIESGRAE